MSVLRRAAASCLAAVTALTALAGLAAPTASAAVSASYVALGDSYSSGNGAGGYYSDGTDCLRSPATYGGVIATTYRLALNLQACSGATVNDVSTRQLGALGASTGFVTVTVGGNDVGFARVLTECAQPGWLSNCNAAIDTALGVAERDLPGRLDALYRTIRGRAPQARVVVAGYPRLFNGQDCHLLTFFSSAEMTRLNAAADRLNAITASAAARAGFRFADVRGTFAGHAVCDSPAWINNLRTRVAESYHPTSDGYRYGYAPPVVAGLGITGPLSGSAGSVTTGGQTSSDTTRGRVGVPDLTTASAKAAAERAGVSASELDALVRAQRSGATNAQLESLSEAARG